MDKMKASKFSEELKEKRSISQETPEFRLKKKDVLSESCLGLCAD
jgi:hypothetical protein